jgi:hypothetical protein
MAVTDSSSWKHKMQRRYCEPVYQAFFRPDADVIAVDDSRTTTDCDTLRVDKIVNNTDGQTKIAQRIRTKSSVNGKVRPPDFSLRDADDNRDEIGPLIDAWQSGSSIPDYYAFVIGAATTKRGCLRQGLEAMLFIDLPALMRAIATDRLSASNIHSVEPRVRARFYPIRQLRSQDLVAGDVWQPDIRSAWQDGSITPEFPCAADDADADRDASLFDFD